MLIRQWYYQRRRVGEHDVIPAGEKFPRIHGRPFTIVVSARSCLLLASCSRVLGQSLFSYSESASKGCLPSLRPTLLEDSPRILHSRSWNLTIISAILPFTLTHRRVPFALLQTLSSRFCFFFFFFFLSVIRDTIARGFVMICSRRSPGFFLGRSTFWRLELKRIFDDNN